MTAIIVNLLTLILLIFSFSKDLERSKKALLKALKKGWNLLPTMFFIIIIIGLIMAFIPREMIQKYLGGEMNFFQVFFALFAGAVAMIPSLIALPLAGSLIDSGASYMPIVAFITSLTMVGFVTLPLELKELGRRITLLRNILALVFASIIAIFMGVLM